MPVCPYCGEEIDHLIEDYYCDYLEHWVVKLNEKGELDYGERVEMRALDGESDGYYCPECGRLITFSWSEAEKFLKGDLETQLKLMAEAEKE